jgi:hypothetical protein
MFPGYGDPFLPYVSPIRIDEVAPEKTGRSILRLRFFNAGYVLGVQDFSLRLGVLARRPHHLVAELRYEAGGPRDRHVVIGRIGRQWLDLHVHAVTGTSPPAEDPLDQQQIDHYLDHVNRLTRYGALG